MRMSRLARISGPGLGLVLIAVLAAACVGQTGATGAPGASALASPPPMP